jgi:hypothetical protein
MTLVKFLLRLSFVVALMLASYVLGRMDAVVYEIYHECTRT